MQAIRRAIDVLTSPSRPQRYSHLVEEIISAVHAVVVHIERVVGGVEAVVANGTIAVAIIGTLLADEVVDIVIDDETIVSAIDE